VNNYFSCDFLASVRYLDMKKNASYRNQLRMYYTVADGNVVFKPIEFIFVDGHWIDKKSEKYLSLSHAKSLNCE